MKYLYYIYEEKFDRKKSNFINLADFFFYPIWNVQLYWQNFKSIKQLVQGSFFTDFTEQFS